MLLLDLNGQGLPDAGVADVGVDKACRGAQRGCQGSAQDAILPLLLLLLLMAATVTIACAGAILVNPWNINDVAAAIEDALTMSEEERRERHRQNYMHVATHTAQVWC